MKDPLFYGNDALEEHKSAISHFTAEPVI